MPITKRVSGPITSTATRRLTPVEKQIDPWDGAWGSAWDETWRTTEITLGLEADVTKRVSGTPTPNHTKRVSGA